MTLQISASFNIVEKYMFPHLLLATIDSDIYSNYQRNFLNVGNIEFVSKLVLH